MNVSELLKEYRNEEYSYVLHSIIKECLERMENIRQYKYSSHYDLKSLENSLLQFHSGVEHNSNISLNQLSYIRYVLYQIQQSCFIHDNHIGQIATSFGAIGIGATVLTYLCPENSKSRYWAKWSMGVAMCGTLFFGSLYMDLNF
jgi:hypothetical protein